MCTLLDSGSHRKPMRDGHNKVYISLLDVIESKEGRFHDTQLGMPYVYYDRTLLHFIVRGLEVISTS
jgi:hypothetical protein